MSEHDQKVLDRLEQEFRPAPARRAVAWWSTVEVSTRLVAAAIAMSLGLVLMTVALVLNSAVGVGLALVAYGLLVGSSTVLVDSTPQARAARTQGPRSRSLPARYFP